MAQQGQVFKLNTRRADGKPTWAYRYRIYGRGSARPQAGGFAPSVLSVVATGLYTACRRISMVTQARSGSSAW
jgi:hypothetical protein